MAEYTLFLGVWAALLVLAMIVLFPTEPNDGADED